MEPRARLFSDNIFHVDRNESFVIVSTSKRFTIICIASLFINFTKNQAVKFNYLVKREDDQEIFSSVNNSDG